MNDYDYGNLRRVNSWADDFLNYPDLTGITHPVSVASWSEKGGDHHRNYLKWYFAHLPRANGTNPDGRLNNWWRYLYDFSNYTEEGAVRPAFANITQIDQNEASLIIHLGYSSAKGILPQSFDLGDIAIFNEGSTKPVRPASVTVSDDLPGSYRTAAYHFPQMTASMLSRSNLRLYENEITQIDGDSLRDAEWTFLSNTKDLQPVRVAHDRKVPRQIAAWAIGRGGKVALIGDPHLIENLDELPNDPHLEIEELIVPSTDKQDEKLVFDDLVPLQALKFLRKLDVRSTNFRDRGAEWIARTFPLLTELNLHNCNVTNASLAHLAKLTELESLDLGYNHFVITDDGARHLAALNNLKRLNLHDTGITDRTLTEVCTQLPRLEWLHLLGTKVTRAGVAQFKAACPKCVVDGFNP